jgi:hypothetical protein
MEVKLGSLAITVVSSLLLPDVVEMPPLLYWQAVIYWAIALFPTAMWGTYFGFRWFHAIVDKL